MNKYLLLLFTLSCGVISAAALGDNSEPTQADSETLKKNEMIAEKAMLLYLVRKCMDETTESERCKEIFKMAGKTRTELAAAMQKTPESV